MMFFRNPKKTTNTSQQSIGVWLARFVCQDKVYTIKSQMFMGAAMTLPLFPIKVMAANLEKKMYPLGTPLGIPSEDTDKLSFQLYGCFVAPLLEEVIFRGLIMPGIHSILQNGGWKNKYAKIGSVIGSSFLFSALHLKGMQFHTFIGGLAYGTLTTFYKGSLVSSTVAHMLNNITAMIYLRLEKSEERINKP